MKHSKERTVRDVITFRPRAVINPDAKSSYQRYAKAPFQYSQGLRAWERRMGAKHKTEDQHNA